MNFKEIIKQAIIETLEEGYYSRDKCVYKKGTNEKVGCTKGPVKKYLAALHANVPDARED